MSTMAIRNLVEQLALYALNPVLFESAADIKEITSQLPQPLPADLQLYLDECVPTASYGTVVQFHSKDNLIVENSDAVPGVDAIKQGFLCFANEGDGSQIAYYCGNQKIYHIGPEAGLSTEQTIMNAHGQWPSLEDFLRDCLRQEENLAE